MPEEIRGVTWDATGAQLTPFQAAQRLYRAGFEDAVELATIAAVIRAESGWYLKAWHHNVQRDGAGGIDRDPEGRLVVTSTDLGFIQRNVEHTPWKHVADDDSQAFVDELFAAHPDLARADKSAAVARQLFEARGFQPWYAYSNGSYERHLGRAVLAVGNFLAVELGLGQSYLEVRGR
jgi:hypothetical protein